MQPLLSVITCVTRPTNLARIAADVEQLGQSVPLEWLLVVDCACNCLPAGARIVLPPPRNPAHRYHHSRCKNAGMQAAHGRWLWWLDDDTTVADGFAEGLLEALATCPEPTLLVFGQMHRGLQVRHAAHEHVQCNSIDQGQFVVRRDLVGEISYPEDVYADDWSFLSQYYERHAAGAVFDDRPLTLYNALRA
ncbi:MAG: glycosyltransferase [Planctomycetota bacterium]